MPESVQSCFELSIHFPIFFSRELFLVAVHGWFGNVKTQLDAFQHSYIPQLFSVKFPIHGFFRSDVL